MWHLTVTGKYDNMKIKKRNPPLTERERKVIRFLYKTKILNVRYFTTGRLALIWGVNRGAVCYAIEPRKVREDYMREYKKKHKKRILKYKAEWQRNKRKNEKIRTIK